MPSSSMRLTRVASVKRGGGSVKCWLASILSLPRALALVHFGQTAAVFFVIVVAAFLIEFQKAIEANDLAGRAEIEFPLRRLRQNIDRGAFEFGQFHLACDRARPNEFVEPPLIRLETCRDVLWQAGKVGRADRFMRFLGILGLHRIFARRLRDIFRAEFLADDAARAADRLRREVDAVGAHIGDEPHRLAADFGAFIEPLGKLHGARGCKAQLARGLLLQRRGGERRRRMPLRGLRLDAGHREFGGFKGGLEGFRFRPRANIETVDTRAIGPRRVAR